MASLVVLKFASPDGAQQGLELAARLQKEHLLKIVDAATVSWPAGRKKPKTRQHTNLAAAGALDGAFWGIVSGFVFNAVPWLLDFTGFIELPSYLNPILLGALVSLVVTIAISRQGAVSEAEHAYRDKLHRTPQEEIDQVKTKGTLIAPLVLILYGCAMPFVMLHWYVGPYQRGSGELLADGSINWNTGEALLSLSWAALYIPLGLFVYRFVRKGYGPISNR
jgi:sodium/pantothenate symporter